MRGLFIQPFHGGSHRAFSEGLFRHSRHDFELLALPEGEWRQRMRRGAQELAAQSSQVPGNFDFIVATDMLDLPAFLALMRRRFGDTPVLLYMHENQFTYPRIRGTKLNSWFGQINYLSALAADRVAFNSAYHRDDFLGALQELARTPNNWLMPESIDAIAAKSCVLPVGVELGWLEAFRPAELRVGPPLLLWAHRWEFDKAPDVFVRAIERLHATGLPFEIAVAGEPGVNPHPALVSVPGGPLGTRLRHFGHVERREDFARLLWEARVAVSTTRHEFFGVGMVEAMACECVPIAPRRYNYPALAPPEWHDDLLWEDEGELFDLLVRRVTAPPDPGMTEAVRASALRFDWSAVGPLWDAALEELAAPS